MKTKHKKQCILLTGATGFLGSHILKSLYLQEKKYDLIVIKRSSSSLDKIKHIGSKVKFYNIDQTDLSEIFNDNKIDIIIHTAVEYGKSTKACSSILETNLMFPIAILEEAIKHDVKMFINTDSYFNKDNLAYSSLLHYALSKKSLLAWLKYFSRDIKIINVILEHIYGPNDGPSKFVENIIQKIAIQQIQTVELTDGQQKRDFIYVNDVVNAYLRLLQEVDKKFHFREYNLGTGLSSSIREFTLKVKKISKSPTELLFGNIPYRNDEIMDSVADNLELQNLGWQFQYNLDDGIREIIKQYQQ